MHSRQDFVPSHVTGLLGLGACVIGVLWLRGQGKSLPPVEASVVLLLVVTVPMLVHDLWILQVHRRISTGLASRAVGGPLQPGRWLVKYIGLLGTLGAVALAYWLFPEYKGNFYKPFWEVCRWAVPVTLVLAVVYIPFVDARMSDPEDSYYQLGRLLTGRARSVDWGKLRFHALNWLIKGYFLPLMFVYLTRNVKFIQQRDFAWPNEGFGLFYDWMYNLVFTVDLVFVVVGYALTLRLLDAHIRRPETTMLGWVSALLCYQPFWSSIEQHYLAYGDRFTWGAWLGDSPVLYAAWGSVLLVVLAGFAWATVVFGLRFSNLTHRGVIVFGPYAFTKHPAYTTKIVSFALISIPFVPQQWDGETVLECFRRIALLVILAFVYWVRALTEERNLGQDPAYRIYARWMRMRHRRWTRFLRPAG